LRWSDDPHKLRDDVKQQILELVDETELPPLSAEAIAQTRSHMKFLIGQLLDNTPIHVKRGWFRLFGADSCPIE